MIARCRLAHLPTPIEPMPRLTQTLKGPTLLVKRDDQTGLAFGGNKTRKLEYLLADANNQGAQTLITAGAVQSNHCRQTAAAAARFGLGCILVLFGEPPEPPDANYLLFQLLGAEIHLTSRDQLESTLNTVYQEAKIAHRNPYLIPYGGSNPIGAQGYVHAMQELAEQSCQPDWIIFPSSSGGTQAGLVVGARACGFGGKILGISVDEPAPVLSARVAGLANQTAALLSEDGQFSPAEILVNDAYIGAGYAVMGQLTSRAIRLFAEQEALLLDPVYTGKAAAALVDLIHKGYFNPDETVLFWHTGGNPVLLAHHYLKDLLD